MNRLSVLVLMGCLLTPLITTYSWLRWEKHNKKKAIKQQLIKGTSRDKLVLFCFSKENSRKQLRWEHAHEFEYLGEMYDVVEAEDAVDSIRYWCWPDAEETQLNRQLKALVAHATGRSLPGKESRERLTHFLKHLFYHQNHHSQIATTGQKLFVPNLVTDYYAMHSPPPVPPPEI